MELYLEQVPLHGMVLGLQQVELLDLGAQLGLQVALDLEMDLGLGL